MSLWLLALITLALFWTAYRIYGFFLSRHFDLQDHRKTPACEINDGIDYVPTEKKFLLGQHFSAISAAGPIVGPILAGVMFGWLPVLLWIIVGGIFFGAVHDFSSLVASVRHKATSIVEIAHTLLGRRGYLLFLFFVWFSLLYVITAFTDLTSASFVDPELGGGVATSSVLYLVIGILMGLALRFGKISLNLATAIFLPLVLLSIWGGQRIPFYMPATLNISPQQLWNIALLFYCLVASIIPVWLLLQPRGYLGGYFLYATLGAGIIGLFLGGETTQYPAFTGFVSESGLSLFPLLFVTVACGAVSGFHGIVCSGTTSKQITKESDCRLVGYGGMLLECLVAVIALSTVMVLGRSDALASASPDRIYAEGLSRFISHLGLPREFTRAFVLLAFTTFIYDTLDVATRLTRYLLQELTGWKGRVGKLGATLISLAIPLFCVSLKAHGPNGVLIPAWKLFWTVFGTSNQLLASLTLLILSTWLYRSKKSWHLCILPMIFMMIMTVWSLGLMIRSAAQKLFSTSPTLDMMGVIALILCALATLLVWETYRTLKGTSAARNL